VSTTGDDGRRDQVYRLRRSAIDWLDVEGDVVALDSAQSVYLSTNESGAALWRALVDGATRAELAQQLVATYDIDQGRALVDVDQFLNMVTEQNLLEEAGD